MTDISQQADGWLVGRAEVLEDWNCPTQNSTQISQPHLIIITTINIVIIVAAAINYIDTIRLSSTDLLPGLVKDVEKVAINLTLKRLPSPVSPLVFMNGPARIYAHEMGSLEGSLTTSGTRAMSVNGPLGLGIRVGG
ncbi:unnamed protein product [Clonostachys solani]|uniref:Uncharacterized protein n=1 Tax=Clonostachys solani TaxID=160281 RepID=A0A9P0ERW4_9HYPO|nr:unnamed protein product [Clonostachys solani]